MTKDAESFRRYAAAFVLACCFVFYNVSQPSSVSFSEKTLLRGGTTNNVDVWAQQTQKFNSPLSKTGIDHLIIVTGHSILLEGDLKNSATDENLWFLLDYQKGKGLPQAIVSHIKAGIAEASMDSKSLLVFSGGVTRDKPAPIDEGSSYYRVADALDLWGSNNDVRARTITEEFATDSFQNLLFSICRFKDVVSVYPKKITLVSFSFKRSRFEGMHAPALHIPPHNFHFIGIDPPQSTGFNYLEASKGEKANAASQFVNDPYGCYSEVLKEKRRGRNPFMRTPWYDLTCPDIKGLMHWCGPEYYPKEKIPWAQ